MHISTAHQIEKFSKNMLGILYVDRTDAAVINDIMKARFALWNLFKEALKQS